jgi:hypothetical protein
MTAEEVLKHLKKAKGPHRNLDQNIGLLLGYERRSEAAGNGDSTYFVDPSGIKMKVPDFTRSLDSAHVLVETLLPKSVAALTWEGENCTARIWGGPPCEAQHPALALCIAALTIYVGEV